MNLYFLNTDNYGYDEHDGFVIRASTELEAREIANGIDMRFSDTAPKVWLDTTKSTCTVVTVNGEVGLILASFNAG